VLPDVAHAPLGERLLQKVGGAHVDYLQDVISTGFLPHDDDGDQFCCSPNVLAYSEQPGLIMAAHKRQICQHHIESITLLSVQEGDGMLHILGSDRLVTLIK
jgi:hypothetical protein